MAQREEDVTLGEDVLSLSFLDVLSCGLGATIYLFLIFSIMPHLGSEISMSAGDDVADAWSNSIGDEKIRAIARSAPVSIEIRIGVVQSKFNASDIVRTGSWGGTLPRKARRFEPIALSDGRWLASCSFDGRLLGKRVIKYTLDPSSLPAEGSLEINAVTLVGGSMKIQNWNVAVSNLKAAGGVLAEFNFIKGDPDNWVVPTDPEP